MSQELIKTEKSAKSVEPAEKTIPGPVVVAGVGVFVVIFPLLALAIERYAQHVGQTEGLRPGYSAYRDPKQWWLSLGICLLCGLIAWGMGRLLRKR